eukprot:10724382-Alexandrium_andersonii.AAC.1
MGAATTVVGDCTTGVWVEATAARTQLPQRASSPWFSNACSAASVCPVRGSSHRAHAHGQVPEGSPQRSSSPLSSSPHGDTRSRQQGQ